MDISTTWWISVKSPQSKGTLHYQTYCRYFICFKLWHASKRWIFRVPGLVKFESQNDVFILYLENCAVHVCNRT